MTKCSFFHTESIDLLADNEVQLFLHLKVVGETRKVYSIEACVRLDKVVAFGLVWHLL